MITELVYLFCNENKKIIIINISLVIILLLSLEILARIYIGIKRGDSTVGLTERTLNLKYQPLQAPHHIQRWPHR